MHDVLEMDISWLSDMKNFNDRLEQLDGKIIIFRDYSSLPFFRFEVTTTSPGNTHVCERGSLIFTSRQDFDIQDTNVQFSRMNRQHNMISLSTFREHIAIENGEIKTLSGGDSISSQFIAFHDNTTGFYLRTLTQLLFQDAALSYVSRSLARSSHTPLPHPTSTKLWHYLASVRISRINSRPGNAAPAKSTRISQTT